MTNYDVVTIGETMLRLTPPNFLRLGQTKSLDVEVGGSESNTAVGLARLGAKVAWLSRLPCNPLGKVVTQTLTGYGVDTSHVQWSDSDRLGLYFYEEGVAPRGSRVIYDRAASALSQMTPAHLPEDMFQPGRARLLHLTGITPALSANVAQMLQRAAALAKQAGWLLSFDVNYRGKLWSTAAARAGCAPFVATADILFMPLRDAVAIYGVVGDAETAVSQLHHTFPHATIVLTLGKEGAIGCEASSGQIMRQPAFPAAGEIGRLGGGDAFTAGFLYGYLYANDDPLANALRWGTATAAIKYTIPGDMPLIEKSEVEALLTSNGSGHSLSR
ncbi:MAG: sugar kinase [Chloroflexota bacterium]